MADRVERAKQGGFATTDLNYPQIRPLVPPKWQPPKVETSVITVSRYSPVEPYKKVDLHNGAQEYFEDSYIDAVTPSPYVGFYEVARLYSPQGKIGIVRQAWQWVELKTPDPPPPRGHAV